MKGDGIGSTCSMDESCENEHKNLVGKTSVNSSQFGKLEIDEKIVIRIIKTGCRHVEWPLDSG
jgi:hypothetical protein